MLCSDKKVRAYIDLIGEALDEETKGRFDIYAEKTNDLGRMTAWKIVLEVVPKETGIIVQYYLDDYYLYEFDRIKDRKTVVAHLATIVNMVNKFYQDLDLENDQDTTFTIEWNKDDI